MNYSKKRKNTRFRAWVLYSFFILLFTITACSFDYGTGQGLEDSRPDIVMENVDYVRVRGGDVLARFHADHAERWENRQTMEITNFSFEQLEDQGQRVNVEGNGKRAMVQTDSGDIRLYDGVRISIESEDIIISTIGLEWKDNEKTIKGFDDEEVEIQRSDGTIFLGVGLSADIRSRIWSFSGEVKGTYVEEDAEEENNEEGDNQ